MSTYTRPKLTLRTSLGDVVGTYKYEYQAIEAAQLQVADTYTLERPDGTLVGGTGIPPTSTIPEAPTTLIAEATSSTTITLSWSDNSDDELGFEVEQSADGATGWNLIDTTGPTITSFAATALTGLIPETVYYFRVRAVNDAGASAYTNIANDTTLAVVAPSTDIPTATRAIIEDNFTLQPQDGNGWTIFEPTANTMVYYIDYVNGNDDTATPYASNAFADMKNPTMAGLTTYKTLDGAWGGVSGDAWFLLRGGTDHTYNGVSRGIPSGISNTVRLVIAGYDTIANGMPRFGTMTNNNIRYWNGTSYTSIIGVDFTVSARDPDHVDFVGWGFTSGKIEGGIIAYTDFPNAPANHDNLIEGCRFAFSGVRLHYNTSTVVRRNTFLNNYSEDSHAQGLLATESEVLLEENIFDHNGWWDRGESAGNAKATIFNHNTYFSSCSYCHFRNNVFSRPSSIGTKFTANPISLVPLSDSLDTIRSEYCLVENNFYMDAEVGSSMGGNTDRSTGPRWQNWYFLNNFLTDIGESQQTNRTLGWCFDVQDWNIGSVSGNVARGTTNNAVTNTFGIEVKGHNQNVSVNDNVFYNVGAQDVDGGARVMKVLQATVDATYTYSNADPFVNVVFDNNSIQNPLSRTELYYTTCASGLTVTNNKFYGVSTDTAAAFEDLSGDTPFATWNTVMGGTNTYGAVNFVDATRDQASYMASIGGTATLQGFLDAIRAQSYDNWDQQLTGGPISAYMLAGFVPV